MEPILSREAHVVGWLKHGIVFGPTGEPRAFVRGRAVLDLDAQYLGQLEHGFFRDQLGDAVAFMQGASGGPVTPTPRVIPEPPRPWHVRILPDPRVIRQAMPPSVQWSQLDWDAFLAARPLEDIPGTAVAADRLQVESPGPAR